MDTEANIDKLLERYLHLLHEYTTLRDQLNNLQTGIYQNIARANFSAERGMRFGQDHYDERMQASRKLVVVTTVPGDDGGNSSTTAAAAADVIPSLKVVVAGEEDEDEDVKGRDSSGRKLEKAVDGGDNHVIPADSAAAFEVEVEKKPEEESKEQRQQPQRKPKDPMRWFGLLTPVSLRQAQAQSIRAVEQIVPKLVAVNTEMARVEIEVRRARKKRDRANAAALKQEGLVGTGKGTTM